MKERLQEPSTWAGLAILVAQAAKLLKPEWSMILDGLASMLAGAAVVKREGAR